VIVVLRSAKDLFVKLCGPPDGKAAEGVLPAEVRVLVGEENLSNVTIDQLGG